MTYKDKLRNPKWQKKRLEVLNRDQFTCCLCGDKDTELHVHHKKYTGEPWEAELSDLKTVCKDCHKVIHDHKIDNLEHPFKIYKTSDEATGEDYLVYVGVDEVTIYQYTDGYPYFYTDFPIACIKPLMI